MNCKKTFLALLLLLGMIALAACNGPVIPEDSAAPDQLVEKPVTESGEEQISEPDQEEQPSEPEKEEQAPVIEQEDLFTEEDAKALAKKLGVQTFGSRVEDYGFRSCVADEKGYTVTYAKGFEVAGLDFLYQIVTTLNTEGELLDCTHTHEVVHELPFPDEPEMVVENITNEQLLDYVKKEHLADSSPKIFEDTVKINNIKFDEYETGYKLQLIVGWRFETPDGLGGLWTVNLFDYYVQ